MSSFTIRVELHNASRQNYADLEADLARFGITDEIVASTGVTYKMPPAEYNYEGRGDIDDVLSTARGAADRTGRSNAVFVTEALQRKWNGLPPSQSRRSA